MQLKKLALVLGAILLVFTSSSGWAAQPTESGKFVEDLAHKVLAVFKSPRLSFAQKEEQMYPIAVHAFDIPPISRFVLGRFWKDTSVKQRDEFTKTFEHYMVHIYVGKFDLYHDVEVQLVFERPEDTTRTLVRTKIIRHDGRPPITVDWHVMKAPSGYKIRDVSVEGVSELLALREQFTEVIEHHDGSVAALIDQLKQKIAEQHSASPGGD